MKKFKYSDYDLKKISITKREDFFFSKYYDYQISYRYLFRLKDGQEIESSAYQHFRNNKQILTDLSIDIATMMGCPLRCLFCESSLLTYMRTLTINEMTSQVINLVEKHDFHKFPQIVCSFQGIGDPSLMPHDILKTSEQLLKYDERVAISIGTIGANLDAFKMWRESGVPIHNLQVSCSGTTSSKIKWLMPHSPPLNKLIDEIKKCSYSKTFEKVKVNYILIQGINDSDKDVSRLISFYKETPIIVKISSLNPTLAAKRHSLIPGKMERAWEISRELQINGVNSYVFGSFKSIDISCGQLLYVQGGKKNE